jgi:hypothetical protein
MKKYLIFSSLITLIISCGPPVTFKESQPIKIKAETEFRKKFQGTYLSLIDSSLVYVTSDKIIVELKGNYSIPKEDLDTLESMGLKYNTLYTKKKQEHMNVKNDTAFLNWANKDTIFKISADNILKYYNGMEVLNFKAGPSNWIVKKMELNRKGILKISEITVPEEIQELRQITMVEEIKDENNKVTEYSINPSEKEFKKLIKSGAFIRAEVFQKIKE